MPMRFNHMELTLPTGTLDDVLRKEIDDFYGEVFGWTGLDTEVVGQLCHLLLTGDGGDFLLLAESDRPMSSPGYDHLGLLQPTRADVDELLERCKRRREQDDRVQIKEYKDLVTGDLVVHAFYVKFALPIWFDVQCMERAGKPVPLAS
jgi:glyoxalase/bleomycin resistance protein/dioxygenase superfamily protein